MKTLASAVVLSALVAAGCGALRVDIVGQAMSPTLKDGDSALATRSFDTLSRGDIVAFRYPKDESKSFVKRIVGMPGERIQSIDGRVVIDGRPLDEAYVADENRSPDSWGPIRVADGEFFVMGDNRRNSSDSRMWGTVRQSAIWAKILGH